MSGSTIPVSRRAAQRRAAGVDDPDRYRPEPCRELLSRDHLAVRAASRRRRGGGPARAGWIREVQPHTQLGDEPAGRSTEQIRRHAVDGYAANLGPATGQRRECDQPNLARAGEQLEAPRGHRARIELPAPQCAPGTGARTVAHPVT